MATFPSHTPAICFKIIIVNLGTRRGIMSDAPTFELLERKSKEEEDLVTPGAEAAVYIPDVADAALDVVADVSADAVIEAGGTLVEGAAETVVDAIGSVLGSIFG
jgi:hypothetical protein